MTSVQELLHLPQGRKRTALRIELLHNINLGETAPFRFLRGYLAALGTSTDEDGNPLDRDFSITHLATDSILSAWAECSRFIRENETNLTHLDDERAGHNFWLTRNSHSLGGFFDEKVDDESAEIAMQQLTRASEAFGEVDLYIGDDRKLHFSNERSIV